MSYMIGGYLFVPPAASVSDVQVAEGAIAVLRQPLLWSAADVPYSAPAPVTAADFATRLELSSQVVADFPQARMKPLLSFEHAGGYRVVKLVVDSAHFARYYYDEGAPPAIPDAFAAQWVALCQRLEASYGYFSPLIQGAYEEFRDETILPALGRRDVQTLAAPTSWLTYLGPLLAPLWSGRSCLNPEETMTERLASGALLIRCGVYPAPIP